MLAFAGLSAQQAKAEGESTEGILAPKAPHFAPKAKRIIFLFMEGGPTQIDTFDYKPEMDRKRGDLNSSHRACFGFQQHGESGLPITELLPETSKHADKLCLINSMYTDTNAHPSAVIAMHTGSATMVRPSMGSWMLYGLGTENQNLPGFVSINPTIRHGGAQNYGSAFLPAAYQGLAIGSHLGYKESAFVPTIPNLVNSRLSREQQKSYLDYFQSLNREQAKLRPGDSELEAVIESYELAFRMQQVAPKVMDVDSEPEHIRKMYGIDQEETSNFGKQCLLARRLCEEGVRFIEVAPSVDWDHHRGMDKLLPDSCLKTDKPVAGLLADLEQRGLLEDTLVLWGGEFGRTTSLNKDVGRGHGNKGFTMWLAGGGVRGGMRYGKTDETGNDAVEGRCHVNDLHATILHLMGLDHERLTYRYSGREFRLTDVHGHVVHDIIA
ncbi:hypothetical protein V22_40580 [Calycomorphotria hydatis]|uniref:Sulfatase n=2 Tax=Calycomorphotria hydatis TaxID=2528027 RepID=A0A517TEI9_9PLAN|nr:hypothetical protein V22_40580 [Calycomorphotria hydatis]